MASPQKDSATGKAKSTGSVPHFFGAERHPDGSAVLGENYKPIGDVVIGLPFETSFLDSSNESSLPNANKSMLTRRYYFATQDTEYAPPFFFTLLPDEFMKLPKDCVATRTSVSSSIGDKSSEARSPFFDPTNPKYIPASPVNDLLRGTNETMELPTQGGRVNYIQSSPTFVPIAFHLGHVLSFYSYVYHKMHHGVYGTSGAASCAGYAVRFLGHQQMRLIKQGTRLISCVPNKTDPQKESDCYNTQPYTEAIGDIKASLVFIDQSFPVPSNLDSGLASEKIANYKHMLIDYNFLVQMIEIFDARIPKSEQRACFSGHSFSDLVDYVIDPINKTTSQSKFYGTWKESAPPKASPNLFANITAFRSFTNRLLIFDCSTITSVDPEQVSSRMLHAKKKSKRTGDGGKTPSASPAVPPTSSSSLVNPPPLFDSLAPTLDAPTPSPRAEPPPASESASRPPQEPKEKTHTNPPPPEKEKQPEERHEQPLTGELGTLGSRPFPKNETNLSEVTKDYRRILDNLLELDRIQAIRDNNRNMPCIRCAKCPCQVSVKVCRLKRKARDGEVEK